MAKLASKLKSPWVLLLGATLLAALVAYAAYAYLTQREARLKEEMLRRAANLAGPRTSVVVPRVDARAGTPVELDVFVSREIDADLVYPDTITAKDFDSVRGQKLARDLLKGRPLRLTDLSAPEIKDVAGILPAGTRAVTIEIDDVNSIAQTLRPGHRVDVFLVSKIEPVKGVDMPEAARQQVSVFMQNLKVIASGKEFQNIDPAQMQRTEKMVRPGDIKRDDNFGTVTVLVTPKEAQRLLMGSKIGTYRIALRGREDVATISVSPLRAGDLLPGTAGRPRGVEYIVGGRQSAGAANLVPTMVPALMADAQRSAAATAATARPTAAQSELKTQVLQSLKEATAPQRHVVAAADQ